MPFSGPLVAILLAVTVGQAHAQTLNWARSFGANANDLIAGVDTDASGNVYIAGSFIFTVDFDPGPGTALASSNGGADLFILKLGANGDFVWVRTFGGTEFEGPFSIAVNSGGDVVVGGTYHVGFDFDPGPGTAFAPPLGDISNPDAFVVKFDTDGDFQWVYPLNSTAIVEAYATFDSLGNVLITGEIGGTIDFDAGVGTANATATGNFEAYILKVDASGNFDWVATAPATPHTRGVAITTDSQNAAIVTGELVGSADVDPGAGTVTINGAGIIDAFIWKLDANGDYVWGGTVGGTQLDYGLGVEVDASDNLLIGGSFQGTADMDPGAGVTNLVSNGDRDAYLLKLDPNGSFLWAISAGDSAEDRVEDIVADPDGTYWAVGAFAGAPDFDPGAGTDVLTATGTENGFVWNVTAAGSHVSAGAFLGPGSIEATHGAISLDEDLLVAGNFDQTMDAAPEPPTSVLTSVGAIDMFVVELGDAPPASPHRAWAYAVMAALLGLAALRKLRRGTSTGR